MPASRRTPFNMIFSLTPDNILARTISSVMVLTASSPIYFRNDGLPTSLKNPPNKSR
ncbi:MAG: hypothetical protein U5L02_05280 [Rheinheimera sp.]|nr:hypothetical protein [Rheinheimera sp.]